MTAAALVFDFDGTIIDTETVVYEAWHRTFLAAGVEPVARDVWVAQIGKADGDALDVRELLARRMGVPNVPVELEAQRRAIRDELLFAAPLRDGVAGWMDTARSKGIRLAIASSSSNEWVTANLDRLGLAARFSVVSCAGDGVPGKPDPAVYVSACARLGVAPAETLAVEDSPHGVSAAVGAGMRCVAAPGPLTRHGDFSHATVRVDSLGELDPADYL